ncbi:hypothetical protein, partial [Actinoplanes sp. NBRC 103695]|uniref:hypothetical protein n=1 Tax=Actinoplanes sp. NBRC 103695 TaxID=3032202 RepID=UPI002554D8C7
LAADTGQTHVVTAVGSIQDLDPTTSPYDTIVLDLPRLTVTGLVSSPRFDGAVVTCFRSGQG